MNLKQLFVSLTISLIFALSLVPAAFAQSDDTEIKDNAGVELTIAIGEGWNSVTEGLPIFSFDVEVMFDIKSIWRAGLVERVDIDKNWVHKDNINVMSTTLFMNEYVVYQSDSFEFTPRVGVGFSLFYFKNDSDESWTDDYGFGFCPVIDLGIGLGWNVTPNVLLGLNLDYTLGLTVGKKDSTSPDEIWTDHAIDLMFAATFKF